MTNHTLSPNFFRGGGVSDKNENLVENFFACGGFFSSGGTENRAKEPLKFPESINFLKKLTSKFFRLRFFFRKIGQTILQIWSPKEGGG